MPRIEPDATAFLLLVIGILMTMSIVLSRLSHRIHVPLIAIFLSIGMLAGEQGLFGIRFEDYALSFRLGTIALVLILFDGGLNAPVAKFRRYLAPSATLATLGVGVTTVLIALGGRLLSFSWPEALLLGAIVSSTDAAAVFSILRGVRLQHRLAFTLELESGVNDPMAVLLTIAFTEALTLHKPIGFGLVWMVVAQLVVGVLVGILVGYTGRFLLMRLRLTVGGMFPVLTLALAFTAFGSASLAHGSGFLAVYLAAILIGNGSFAYKSALLRVHDFLAWCSQVLMFVVLGLLVFPSRLLAVAPVGLGIAALSAFFARPLATLLCLLPFGYPLKEIGFIGWLGLRGAVPIVLATIPILAGVEAGDRIFNVIFFVVVVSALLQGGTARWLTARLKLDSGEARAPDTVLEIASTQTFTSDLMSFQIGEASAACGAQISELPFPEGASAMLIVRGPNLLAPKGTTVLGAGDHVYVFCQKQDRGLLQLLFGQQERE